MRGGLVAWLGELVRATIVLKQVIDPEVFMMSFRRFLSVGHARLGHTQVSVAQESKASLDSEPMPLASACPPALMQPLGSIVASLRRKAWLVLLTSLVAVVYAAPGAPGTPTFSNITATNVHVTAPSLPTGAVSLTLQRKLSTQADTAYVDVLAGLAGT